MKDIREFIEAIEVTSLEQYEHEMYKLQYYRYNSDFHFFYRGHSIHNFELSSGLTRVKKYKVQELRDIESKLFQEFKNNCLDKLAVNAPHKEELRNEWHILFQAQHLGLKTRLLDWSLSYRVALWFAVENERNFNEDGAVWIFACLKQNHVNVDRLKELSTSCHPFENNDDLMINPPIHLKDTLDGGLAQNRIRIQNGRLWLQSHENSLTPMEKQIKYNEQLFKIIIKHEYKAKLKEELANNGLITNETIYDRHFPVLAEVEKINNLI